jgi:hypothetical protein
MRGRQLISWLLVATFFVSCGGASAQDTSQNRTLTVSGQPGNAPVIQVNGRSYVDLEALARVSNASLSFAGNQIVLTFSGGATSTPAAAVVAAPVQVSNPGFSKSFLNAGIEEAATLREWHTALASAIQNGYPVTSDALSPYRLQAMTNLRLASTAVSTDSDRKAYQLLSNEFQNMAKMSDKYVAARANLTYISPDALQNDSLNQRFVACGHSLGAMAASGQFVDDGSCN